MGLYHPTIKTRTDSRALEEINPMAVVPLLGYIAHLKESWPNIADSIQIGFIQGTKGAAIGVSHTLGWDNLEWRVFLHYGLALPIALDNCKKYGINTFVLVCGNSCIQTTPDELYSYGCGRSEK